MCLFVQLLSIVDTQLFSQIIKDHLSQNLPVVIISSLSEDT